MMTNTTTQRSALVAALEDKLTLTENGMPTNETSGKDLLDAFFNMGGSRNLSDQDVRNLAIKAYQESPAMALRLFAYNRDIRGGQGERRSFRITFRWLAETHPNVARQFIPFVPFYGRFDDLFEGIGTPIQEDILDFFAEALEAGDALAAKWSPRENKSKGRIAKLLREHMNLSARDYRKLVASASNTVEDLMCAKRWDEINYSHVPSVAANRYRKAFYRNDETRYQAYLAELKKPVSERDPSVKVNAGAIFPHDIASPFIERLFNVGYYGHRKPHLSNEEQTLLEAQWEALPEFTPEDARTLALVDTSGSMNGLPINVAISLGLYLSERLTGPFKDVFMTFSERPKLQRVSGRLGDRISQMCSAHFNMNTNLELAFREILNTAVEHRISESDMPSTLIILSDMQFDHACRSHTNTGLQMIRREYMEAGYQMPNVIFWNLRTSHGVPVRYTDSGVALVSGFSPSTLKHILSGRINPIDQMVTVLTSDRYERLSEITF